MATLIKYLPCSPKIALQETYVSWDGNMSGGVHYTTIMGHTTCHCARQTITLDPIVLQQRLL